MSDTPDQASPWALQLAARVEKLTPPTTLAVCRATVLATIALLDDERNEPDGPWHDAIASWSEVRIRKIVRRARASAWERAQQVPGVTVESDGAEVRAFVPTRMADAPPEVTKLQIQSTPLDDVDRVGVLPPIVEGAMVIGITPAVDMSWGKSAAQCAHAGQLLWRAADLDRCSAWTAAGRPITIVPSDGSLWPELVDRSEVQVHDAGFTEIPAGTNTTVAWWAASNP